MMCSYSVVCCYVALRCVVLCVVCCVIVLHCITFQRGKAQRGVSIGQEVVDHPAARGMVTPLGGDIFQRGHLPCTQTNKEGSKEGGVRKERG